MCSIAPEGHRSVHAGSPRGLVSARACTQRGIEPFETSLPLDLFQLRALRHDLTAWLDGIHVVGGVSDEIVLATHEAAANAIEHAEKGSDVTVRGVRDDDKIIIVVMNSGTWKKPRPASELRGRGLALMKRLMSELEIQVKSERTVVRMRKDLPGPARGTEACTPFGRATGLSLT